MKIPKKIKIGAHIYSIVEKDIIDDDANTLGQCSQDKLLIELKKDLPQDIKEKAFLHEILHAINWDLDEQALDFFAHCIYQVLKDNNLIK